MALAAEAIRLQVLEVSGHGYEYYAFHALRKGVIEMKSRITQTALWTSLLCIVMILSFQCASLAVGSISNLAVTPGEGTSNSVYEYSVLYKDEGDVLRFPVSLYLVIDDSLQPGILRAQADLAAYALATGQSLVDGVTFRWRLSAGLDLKQLPLPTKTSPGGFSPNKAFSDAEYWKRVFYHSTLTDKQPATHKWRIEMTYSQPGTNPGDPPIITQKLVNGPTGPIVHDSFRQGNTIDRYGGIDGDEDYLTTFPYGYPFYNYVDPLSVDGAASMDMPDAGTPSNTFTFRTLYDGGIYNSPPSPWVRYFDDPWNSVDHEEGVMLYLRNLDRADTASSLYDAYWGIFQPHHMYRRDVDAATYRTDYILNVGPAGPLAITGADHGQSIYARTSRTNHYYEAMPPGRYEYFYACSDDNFSAFATQTNSDKYLIWPYLEDSVVDTGLNPHVANLPSALPTPPPPDDVLFGTMGLNYKTRTDSDGIKHGYVSKRTYMPGAWTHVSQMAKGYNSDSWRGSAQSVDQTNFLDVPIKYPAYTYPEVNPGLYQVGAGEPNGGARFLGTISPYKRAVNPFVPYQDVGDQRMWSETAGGTQHDQFTFKINYWQSAGVEPTYVRLFIKSAANADNTDGTFTGYSGFISYDMTPTPGQDLTPFGEGFKHGVTYQVTLSGGPSEAVRGMIGPGPHVYYFEAADKQWTDSRNSAISGVSLVTGGRTVHYPRRPDTYSYNSKMPSAGVATWFDQMLPNRLDTDANTANLPVQNDIILGPYVNTKPVIVPNSWSVTPSSGTAGKSFVFRVMYRDADNQRPYQALVTIETGAAGGPSFSANMYRAPDSSVDGVPGVPGNSTKTYAEGVVYEFRSSSAPGLLLSVGDHRYMFTFTDDWGRQIIPDDRIAGETVTSAWFGGPSVSGNSAPRLSLGSVKSADGTTNETTTWNYEVTYTDADNNAPAYIITYIGRQDTPGGSIVWDSGNVMTPSVSTDTVYSDGKLYSFSTTLPGDNTTPIKYYSCFVASDGLASANYVPVTSPSSGMIWPVDSDFPTQLSKMELLTSIGGSSTAFRFAHPLLVTDIPPSSPLMAPTNYADPVIYVGGIKLTKGSGYTLNPIAGTVNLTTAAVGEVRAKYWFGTEPDVTTGPVAVTGNHPPKLTVGQVVPLKGDSNTDFTYSVIYEDADNQPPLFVNVVIDGVPYAMNKSIPSSNTYKNGVKYQYTMKLSTGTHTFYFETSDGGAQYVFDAVLDNSLIDPITGPFVNDRPTFSNAQVFPNGNVNQSQPITYSVTLTDKDNDAPLPGYPVVYVDNPAEKDWSGTVDSVSTFILDTTQLWDPAPTDPTVAPVNFAGIPIEIASRDTSGNVNKLVYKIEKNEIAIDPVTHLQIGTRIYLVTSDLSAIAPGSAYTVGKLTMDKADPTDVIFSDGVVYEASVPSLGIGRHKAHFKAIVHEQTQPGLFEDFTLRTPATGDTNEPTVVNTAPAGETAPVLTLGACVPNSGSQGTPFRFAVTYTDAQGDPPLTAAEVIGYIKLWIEDTPGVWVSHDLSTAEDAPSWSSGVEMSTTLTGLALGPHNFYFEASDGWFVTRFPAAGYQTMFVSRPPVLLQGKVTPTSGNTGRLYEYSVLYRDPDNDPPQNVWVVIDGGTPQAIGVPIPGADYVTGVPYSLPVNRDPITGVSLAIGPHNFYFYATDGNGYAWYDKDVRDQELASNPNPHKNSITSTPPTPVVPILEPAVHSNTAPALANGHVTPTTGFDQDTYTYSVVYSDPDGDDPEYVECFIDYTFNENTADPIVVNSHAVRMTKNPAQNDYVTGVTYTLDKTGLGVGDHTFRFRAKDWVDTVYTSEASGPTVASRATANISITVPSSITIGDSATITGTVLGYGGAAVPNIQLKLKLTRPDGAVITPQPTVTTDTNGHFTYPISATWRPSVTGTWKVQATWVGNTQYLASNSLEKSMVVLGPAHTVTGIDMISFPIQPLSTFPDGVLGPTPAFALAKWVPTRVAYRVYSLLPSISTDFDFPPLVPGQGYWIRTLVSKNLAPTGSLVDPTVDFTVALGAGWNQIGDPFTTEVNWSSLRVRRTINGSISELSLAAAAASGWVREYGWAYDTSSGNYKLVDATRSGADRTIQPWRGYWMRALMNCTLVIPGPSRSIGAGDAARTVASAAVSAAPITVPKWQVQLIASNGTAKDECNYIGASVDSDSKMESPSCFENYVDLYLTDDSGAMYAEYLKKNTAVDQEWLVKVATDKSGEVEVRWTGLDALPSNIKLILVDEDGQTTELTPGGAYKFTSPDGGTIKTFHLVIKRA